MTRTKLLGSLARRFKTEWTALTLQQKRLLADDAEELVVEQWGENSDGRPMNALYELDEIETSVAELARRIGRGALYSYVQCLMAAARRRDEQAPRESRYGPDGPATWDPHA